MMTTPDTTICTFSFFMSCELSIIIYRQVTDKSLISAYDVLMWALLKQSSSLLLFRRRKHRVNCHILAAIQATFPTRLGGVNFDFARSQSCRVMIVNASGCKRFHDNWNGYCPQHPWSRWVKCTDVFEDCSSVERSRIWGPKDPKPCTIRNCVSHGCLWRL